MLAEIILGLVIITVPALAMIGIGVSQLKSKTPVAFYSGEKPLRKEELSDMHAWNKKHGIMWIMFGAVIFLSYFTAVIIGLGTTPGLILAGGGPVLFLLAMIRYHEKLIRIYKVRQ